MGFLAVSEIRRETSMRAEQRGHRNSYVGLIRVPPQSFQEFLVEQLELPD